MSKEMEPAVPQQILENCGGEKTRKALEFLVKHQDIAVSRERLMREIEGDLIDGWGNRLKSWLLPNARSEVDGSGWQIYTIKGWKEIVFSSVKGVGDWSILRGRLDLRLDLEMAEVDEKMKPLLELGELSVEVKSKIAMAPWLTRQNLRILKVLASCYPGVIRNYNLAGEMFDRQVSPADYVPSYENLVSIAIARLKGKLREAKDRLPYDYSILHYKSAGFGYGIKIKE
jgi:hypothetical protein